jgi:cytochrome c oxidase subunit 1
VSVAVDASPRGRRGGLLEALTSTDHKRVGLATAAVAFGWFLVGGLLAVLVRTELAAPELQILTDDAYNQVFTVHGSTMLFLFAPPAAVALGVYFVPLQVGAAEVQWPRLALAGLWLLIAGGLILYSGFLVDQGAAKAGWTAYYPLSGSSASPGTGLDFWIIGVILATAAVILQGICVFATVVRRRAPGMTMLRMPVFTWSQVVTIFMIFAAFPVLIGALVLLYIDRHGGAVFAVPGGTITWQHLFWFYAHPLVYVVFFPFVGAVAEIAATFSRRRYFGYRTTVLSLLVFASLSTAVWGHHMFTTGQVANQYFSLSSTLILVPAGIEYFGVIATMWGGRIRFPTPMLFALGFVLLFLIGGLSGVFVGSPPLDYHVHDSYVIVAHFHYTLFGGTIFGLFAALYFWFPKVTGRLLSERLGKVNFALLFVGALLTFIPMFFLGHDGMPRRVADYEAFRGWQPLNLVATIGAYTILLGVAVFLLNVALSLRRGRRAGRDPWEGQTLEWATGSPPARHNFDSLPPVRSHAPLHDLRVERAREAAGAGGARP